eukprot:5332452-Pyramimonas_sp.AAC.1
MLVLYARLGSALPKRACSLHARAHARAFRQLHYRSETLGMTEDVPTEPVQSPMTAQDGPTTGKMLPKTAEPDPDDGYPRPDIIDFRAFFA